MTRNTPEGVLEGKKPRAVLAILGGFSWICFMDLLCFCGFWRPLTATLAELMGVLVSPPLDSEAFEDHLLVPHLVISGAFKALTDIC